MANFEPKTPQDVIALATEGAPEPPPNIKKELLTEALHWGVVVVFAVAFALAMNFLVIVNAHIPTGSMEGTIQVNDRVIAFRHSYRFNDPARYDIIIFRAPDDGIKNVKRIIGLPGERVAISNGRVYINGAYGIREDFIMPGPQGYLGPDFAETLIPEGHFFVLGDSRGNSRDSRNWTNPFVEEGRIMGKVIFRYFPGFRNLSES
ncbi:MAG: signal peptidase I [Defluviitaleaceae bacterium]|nr:signal peptidase I [Defluviitaleaceae bacterium]MCL2274566.1 signal peptidase I [Defluviitaleaceae bacterium]